MPELYKGTTLNVQGDAQPNGTRENQVFHDVIDHSTIDCVSSDLDMVNGQRHIRLYDSSGNKVVEATTDQAQITGSVAASDYIVSGDWFDIRENGAECDVVYVRDAVTYSNTTLTSATAGFVAGDVGKLVRINDGNSNQLLTSIAAYVSGTQVTMNDAASFSASGCELYFGTDDTTAIQDTIDDAIAAGGGKIYFPPLMTMVGGALQDTGNANCQLLLPSIDVGSESPSAIEFIGEFGPYNVGSTIRDVVPQTTGSIIIGMLNSGAGGALFGGKRTGGSFTNIRTFMHNLTVRMPQNPVLTAINFEKVAASSFGSVCVDVGSYTDDGPAQPTTATSYGIKLPEINNGVENRLENIYVGGFYNNIRLGEHSSGTFVQSWQSINGIVVSEVNQASYIKHVVSADNSNHVTVEQTGYSYLSVAMFNVEHAPGTFPAWMQTTYSLNDAGDYLIGRCNYHTVLGGTGAVDNFGKNGGGNFVCTNQSGQVVGASVKRTTSQAISTATPTAIQFTTERFDTDVIHSNSVNNTRLTCMTSGVYLIIGQIRLDGSTTGLARTLGINLNSTDTLAFVSHNPPTSGNTTNLVVQTMYEMTPGDYIELVVYHDATGSLNVQASSERSPVFSMVRMG